MIIQIKRIKDGLLPQIHNGNWMDVYVREVEILKADSIGTSFEFGQGVTYTEGEIEYEAGDVVICRLGFAINLPRGYELHVLPRSGTFRKTGLILTNSMGIGDDTFIGDGDEYTMMFYATRKSHFSIGDRLGQIRVECSMQKLYDFIEVESFGNPDRGGYGTTGK